MPAVIPLISALLGLGGLLVISTTLLPAASGHRTTWVVQSTDVIAMVTAVLIWRLAPRGTQWWQHLVVQGAVVLISTATLNSGGGSTALAYGTVYLLVPVYSFFIFTRRAAVVHLALTVAVGVPVLGLLPGVRTGEQIILWGIALMLSAVIGWLVQAVDEAETDPLTGLANRRGTERALARMVGSTPPDGALAIALMDLDHFAALNDTRGTAAGDQLLMETARTWQRLVPDGGVLGRHGGDEFALLLPGATADAASAAVGVLRAALPGGGTMSAGTAGWAAHESPSMLLARTESAVYLAKHQGRGRTHQHPGAGEDGNEVREALAAGQFAVHFQPVVDLTSGELVGAEALVRWHHPEQGLVMPAMFIPEAERCGVIVELGEFVLREACRQAAAWPAGDRGQPLRVSVNASGRELLDPSYAELVEDALRTSGLGATQLMLELVESHYDIESLALVANLHKLRVMGTSTAIDDFGTGASGPDRVRRLGVDLIKIDRSFVSDITDADAPAPLVHAMLAMAQALGLAVVAEGIETAAQAEWLRRHGCQFGQGYFFGRPTAGPPALVRDATDPAGVRHSV